MRTAERLFAEKGFLKVTMREISQKAEFALGTVYRFFKGKRELYEQLVDQKAREFIACISEGMASGQSSCDKVKNFIETKLTFFFRNMEFTRLYLSEKHAHPSVEEQVLEENLRTRWEEVFKSLVDIFEQGVKEGVFIPANPRMLALALDGISNSLASLWLDSISGESPEAEIEIATRLFFNGFLRRD